MKNKSPWIFELKNTRKSFKLERDETADVVVIGAGIAGVSTAFFLLQETDKKIILIDKYKLAHGATGHNAGQVEAYIEKDFFETVREYGLKMAIDAWKNLEDAWDMIDHMYNTAGLSIPFTRITGHSGYINKEDVIDLLERKKVMDENGVHFYKNIMIADHLPWVSALSYYEGLFELKPHKEILGYLESEDDEYIMADSYSVGCINSALFCEGIIEFLEQKYPDRFSFYENTQIEKAILKEDKVLLDAGSHEINCDEVVLATNGFEHIQLIHRNNLNIDTKFHRFIIGKIGYMSAYVKKKILEPFVASYFSQLPYFYLTRRQYDLDKLMDSSLISVGGPETVLEERKEYDRESEYPEDAKEEIDEFIRTTYKLDPEKDFEKCFTWNGLMGYTSNMLRLIGTEPRNKRLFYNLGCNGVGILPSVYGAWKVGRMIAGEDFPPSVFDPKFTN